MKKAVLALIRFYRKTAVIRGSLARNLFLSEDACRFKPVCSEYTYLAVEKYGVIRGLYLGLKRIFRCNPWNPGGIDPLT